MTSDVIGYIPARGGSRGLSRKNLRPLAGKPLLAWSICVAQAAESIGTVFVDTEDAEIKQVALEWGAEVIDRPAELALDHTLTSDTLRHALAVLEKQGRVAEHIALLQPTSPLRIASDVDGCVEAYLASGARSALTVSAARKNPYKSFLIEDGLLAPLFDARQLHAPRQELPEVFDQNGAVYVISAETFLAEGQFYVPPAVPYVMPADRSLDIDDETDLVIAEALIGKRLQAGEDVT